MGLIKGDIITEGPAGVAFSARARAPELGLSGDTELKKARGKGNSMTNELDDRWWETYSPNYDKAREQRIRAAFMSLIERDVDFTLDAYTIGLHYPGEINLSVNHLAQEDEPFNVDWFFALEGPGFRVVLMAASPSNITLENHDFSMLRHYLLDQVEGEWTALKWLKAPPSPEVIGYI
jgi:hypothetical protein